MPVFESERELEDVLMDNEELMQDHFGGSEFYRQVPLFGYGTADIVSIDTDLDDNDHEMIKINVLELKHGAINFKAIEQVSRYRVALTRMCEESMGAFSYKVGSILIGSSLDDCCVYSTECMEDLAVYTYSIDAIEGLSFDLQHGWYREDESFENSFTENIYTPLSRKVHARNLERTK